MKFTQWIKIKEQQLQTQAQTTQTTQTQSAPGGIKKPQMQKPGANSKVKSILMKSKDLKTASNEISQNYDAQISSQTDPAEMARLAKEKNSTLSALQGG
jgi:hypothetical protein